MGAADRVQTLGGYSTGKGGSRSDMVISGEEGKLTASLRTDESCVIDWRDERVLPEWAGLNGHGGSGRNGLG